MRIRPRGFQVLPACRYAALGAATLSIISCNQVRNAAKDFEDALFEDAPYEPVEGAEASPFLHNANGANPLDVTALLQTLDMCAAEASQETLALNGFALTADSEKIAEVSSAAVDLMNAGSVTKEGLKSSAFAQPNLSTTFKEPPKVQGNSLWLTTADVPAKTPADFNPKTDKVDLGAAFGDKKEIVISTLGRVPVRNQEQRGTCASFAGIGQIEYMIMKKHGAQLSSIDLSEQRFYMMSKSDLWASGGGVVDTDGGSSYYEGFSMSFGTDGKSAPSNDAKYNIPAEVDCPYNGNPGANELQIAQAASCKRGAVRISNLTQSYSTSMDGGNTWTLHSNAPRSASEIIDFLKKHDLPVPIGTILTENWMDNDGMITYAKSTQPGYGPHAGGHAYLIVGARRLDEAQFPNEGGMCFIIRNSWGTGWGQNGYSCMTLAWYNAYRDDSTLDMALDVEADLAYLLSVAGNTVPADLPPPGGASGEVTPGASEDAPSVANVQDPGAPSGIGGIATGEGGGNVPAGEPAATTSDGFTVARLVTPTNGMAQVLYKSGGGSIVIRGVRAGQKQVTQDLSLTLEGAQILLDDSKREKSRVPVGSITGDLMHLCSGPYAQRCHLNYLEASNELVIGVSEAEFRNHEADPNASYQDLVTLGGYGIQFALAGIYSDFRFVIGGQETNPLRLGVKPVSGAIMFRGKEIGNYQKMEFCSGAFSSLCRVVMNSNDRTLNIFFKAAKNP